MRWKDYEPDPRCVKLAARLWRKHMETPEFNQLGRDRSAYSINEQAGEAVCSSMVAHLTRNTTSAQLDKFEAELVRVLSEESPWRDLPVVMERSRYGDGKQEDANKFRRETKRVSHLGTDYGPDGYLAEVGKFAGLPDRQFPIKSHMSLGSIHDGCCVTASFGYGEPHRRFYPLDAQGERWFVTSLAGDREDVDKLLAAVVHVQDKPELAPGRFMKLEEAY